jgi:NAD(P)-dependent dehydrogenase (short-subunit alcohol dehydrogenase family)
MTALALVVGGTSGIGRKIASTLFSRGEEVVIAGRDLARAESVSNEIGKTVSGLALDLTQPKEIARAVRDLGRIDHLVLTAVERDRNSVRGYDIERAVRAVMLKLVGYTEVVHALSNQFAPDASIVILGGMARDRPYPGSTSISMINGGVSSMVRTLAIELAPVRVNAVHPGAVGDSPALSGVASPAFIESIRARTPTGRLVTMENVADAVVMLLDNPGLNGVNLNVDGGFLLTT